MKTNSVRIEIDDLADDLAKEEFLKRPSKPPAPMKASTRNLLKYGSLITLLIQNAALNITMRMARTQKELFISSTAVILAEVLKLVTCLAMILIDEGSTRKFMIVLKTQILDRPIETLKVAVPAIVYYFQNNLIYFGATHLDAATTQVTYQIKILTTALFSVALLNRRLFAFQWLALLILFVGVALVQLQQIGAPKPRDTMHEQRPMLGFIAILVACCLSGFAGVYFEKILKNTAEVSLWLRNIQLSAIAIPFGLVQVFMTDFNTINEKGFFYGYSLITWIVILLQAQGGLLTAVVVKYSDNIMKGFATSLAIILSCIISIYAFDFQLTTQFSIGAAFVIGSLFLFNKQASK